MTEGFRFQIDDAFTVWHGRFITMVGQLLEGSIAIIDPIAVPLKDGTRNYNRVVSLGENDRLVDSIATEPEQQKTISVQIWGRKNVSDILISGIATKEEPPGKEGADGYR